MTVKQKTRSEMSKGISQFLITIFVYLVCVRMAAVATLMGIDFKADSMQISIIRPDSSIEIVLSKESKKEIPVAIAFRDNERIFEEEALSFGMRHPKLCYIYLLDLIGKTINSPVVELFRKRFPHYDIIEDPIRGSIVFKQDDVQVYSPEELLAMILLNVKDHVKHSTNLDMNEVIITVPAYFNQAERKILLSVVQLAGIKVLQLMTYHAAVALDYGRHRIQEFSEQEKYFMFYDMDAYSTVATVVKFQLKKQEHTQRLIPYVTVVGVGFDRTLGGLEVQIRLRNFLARKFNEEKLTNVNAFDDVVVFSKLFAEARTLKDALNVDEKYQRSIHRLVEDDNIDFHYTITRNDLENLCEDLHNRIVLPVQRVLQILELTFNKIEKVILVNYGSHVPFIQRVLERTLMVDQYKITSTEIELAAAGAVYQAAKKNSQNEIILEDAILFPIKISFEKNKIIGEVLESEVVFKLMENYPHKKTIIFDKKTDNFDFNLFYGDLDIYPSSEIENLGERAIEFITVNGVSEVAFKRSRPDTDSTEIEVQLLYDSNGILSVHSIELVTENLTTSNNKVEMIMFRETLKYSEKMLHVPPLSGEQFQESLNKINTLHDEDLRREKQEMVLDALLRAIINARINLQNEDFISFAKPGERINIELKCNELTEWLQTSNAGLSAEYYILEEKLNQLIIILKPIEQRRSHYFKKIEMIQTLEKNLEDGSQFLQSIDHILKSTSDSQFMPYTEDDIKNFKTFIEETRNFLKNVQEEEESVSKLNDSVYPLENVSKRINLLDQLLKSLIGKGRQFTEHNMKNEKDDLEIVDESSFNKGYANVKEANLEAQMVPDIASNFGLDSILFLLIGSFSFYLIFNNIWN